MNNSLHQSFVPEVKACLGRVEQVICSFDRSLGMAGAAGIDACYRDLHTVTGLTGFLALERINKLARIVECLLDEMRTNRLRRAAGRINALLLGVQRIRELIENLASDAAPAGDEDDEGHEADLIREISAWIPDKRQDSARKAGLNPGLSIFHYFTMGDQITTGPPISKSLMTSAA